jgi:AcrR family transcriptional regulator
LILDTALKAFSQYGFDGASTRSIANEAGVNQGLIPYYFGSKQKLWREAVDRAFAALDDAMGGFDPVRSAEAGSDEMARWIRRYVAFVAAHPEFVCLMNEEGKRSGPRMAWLVDRHVRPALRFVGAVLKRGGTPNARVAHVDPIHFTYIFVGAVATIFHQAHECREATGYDPMQPSAVEAHADALVELFLGNAQLGR